MLLALVVLPSVDVAVKLDVDSDIVSLELPRVEVKPVVRDFNLISIDNLLLKDTVSVAQTIAPGGIVEGGERVEEAGSETS